MMDVIIVEDEIVTSLFLEDVLEGLGHSVASTYSHADDLLQRLKSHAKVDLIFMDINIKGSMDGIALAKQIAEFPATLVPVAQPPSNTRSCGLSFPLIQPRLD